MCRYDHLFARVSKYLPQTESTTSDNTSNNGTMNAALCKKIHQVVRSQLSPGDIQIGCGVHVTHLTMQYVLLFLFGPVVTNDVLSSRDILFRLGLAPDLDVEDLYNGACQFDPLYQPELKDLDYAADTKKAQEEATLEKEGQELPDAPLEDEDSDSLDDEDVDNDNIADGILVGTSSDLR